MSDGLERADPFDLPEWLGTQEVIWYADAADGGGHLVRGRLVSQGQELGCDLLAVDEAYPAPVVDDALRQQAHQAWRNGEVLLLGSGDRIVLASPGTRFGAERALEALGRLARAVGAPPERYLAALRVGVVDRED